MINREINTGDDFIVGLCLGYDDGDIRGDWDKRPQILIPKLGEVAILLGLIVDEH